MAPNAEAPATSSRSSSSRQVHLLDQPLVCRACESKKPGMMVASYDRKRDHPDNLRLKCEKPQAL